MPHIGSRVKDRRRRGGGSKKGKESTRRKGKFREEAETEGEMGKKIS